MVYSQLERVQVADAALVAKRFGYALFGFRLRPAPL
jgi:hypothetical protein